MTVEELVVSNVETVREAQGLSRSDIGKRMSALGFGSWYWEKTYRNVVSGDRAVKVDELAGLAVVLGVTILTLLHPGLDDELAGVEVGPYEDVYPVLLDELHLTPDPHNPNTKKSKPRSFDHHRIPMMLEPDWASSDWTPDPANPVPPRLLRYPFSEVDRWIVGVHTNMGWDLPAPLEDLTKEQLEAATARVREWIQSEGESEQKEWSE